MPFDSDKLWQAIEARDPRFDGWVFLGVVTTGIYCRPSCPARTPKRRNVRMFPTAAAAQAAGFRACKRCRPDATPGPRSGTGAPTRRPGDAPDRGRCDRSRRRAGPGAAAWLQRTPSSSRARRRRRRRPGRPGPCQARRDGPDPARDDRPADLRPSRSRPASARSPVQRHDQGVSSPTPREPRGAAGGRAGAQLRRGPAAARSRCALPYRAPFDARRAVRHSSRVRAVPHIEELLPAASTAEASRLPHGGGVVELAAGPGHVVARFVLTTCAT